MSNNRYYPGSSVSRHLPTDGRSWDEAVYQSGKPVLDSELILSQEVNREIGRLIRKHESPSGFIRGPSQMDPSSQFYFPDPTDPRFVADAFYMTKRTALVANTPVVVSSTGTPPVPTSDNLVQLTAAPVNGGAPPDVKRTDFVFLEVFKALVSYSPRASGTVEVLVNPTSGTITIGGSTLSPAGGPRTSGSDDYDNTLASPIAIAADIVSAINDPANSFAVSVSAQADITNPAQVNVIASDAFAGSAGNLLVFTESTGGSEFLLNPIGGFLSGGVDTPNKPTQSSLYLNGNVLSPTYTNLPDDIADPTIGTESTKRVQTQYRIRATGQAEAVNFKTENGFSNGFVKAQGTQTVPTSYRFVPADGVTVLAYVELTGMSPIVVGDEITVDGITLTAVNGVPAPNQFDISSGIPGVITASIVAAITTSVPTVAATAYGNFLEIVPVVSGDNVSISKSLTNSDSINYNVNSAVSYGEVDNGLWIAGDGTLASSDDLGTVDGFVYAIPVAFVFRKNDASGTGGFDPMSNTNGAISYSHAGFVNTHGLGAIPAGVSDRPDKAFHDVISKGDILDLRRNVSPGGIDLKAELEYQMSSLLDGKNQTWAIDTQGVTELGGGSGDVSSLYLVCNEIGDADTPRGQTIGTWDHIRRRFGDQSVVERRLFPLLPTSSSVANPGLYTSQPVPQAGWGEGDVLHIDLDNLDASGLGDWVPTAFPSMVTGQWPAGTKVTNVLGIYHDDGNYNSPVSQKVDADLIVGVGTPHIEITLSPNSTSVNGGVSGAPTYDMVQTGGGSPRRIFVELEISYPVGEGLSATPSEVLNPDPLVTAYKGSAIENDVTKRPTDMENLLRPQFREGHREVLVEYVANEIGSGVGSGTPISDSLVSSTLTSLYLPRRFYSDGVTTVTVTEQGSGVPTPRPIDVNLTTWGSSERLVTLNGNLSSAQTLCDVQYFAQDPVPDFSSPGPKYQISVYFRAHAPQTIGVQAGFPFTSPLPGTITLKPLVMSRDLWTGVISSGSPDLSYPFVNPSDHIAVNADLSSGPSPSFPGEWVLSGAAKISVGDFEASTGLLNLHQMVPVAQDGSFTFLDRDWDVEFRGHYKIADVNSYRPTAMAQPLSGTTTHKVWFPFLAQSSVDNVYFRKGEVLLVVVSRFAYLDGDNTVRFSNIGNDTCAAIYKTRGLLLLASE